MDNIFDLLTSSEQEQNRITRINGVVVGIVTTNKDPEGLGRVKVHFQWLSEDNETDWIRVATFMAGIERGSYFIPEANDEVLLAFEYGDINRPYVIGSLWSKEDKSPEANANGNNDIRKIKSRSGHEIIFDDSAGKEMITIHSNSNHTIVLDDSPSSSKIQINDKSGNNSIQIDSVQNSITISSALNLKINATNIEIESTGMLTIKSGAILTIKGALVKIN
jgi:uncharacterized protein involved in type VI secretion and phage assembly